MPKQKKLEHICAQILTNDNQNDFRETGQKWVDYSIETMAIGIDTLQIMKAIAFAKVNFERVDYSATNMGYALKVRINFFIL